MAIGVKICGVKTPDVAEFAFSHGADWVGLVFAPSTRRLTLSEAREVMQSVPGSYVAVLKDANRDALQDVLNLGIGAVQYYGHAVPDWIGVVHSYGARAIATELNSSADLVLLDGPRPGSGEIHEWRRPQFSRPIWLAGGLTPRNVQGIIESLRPDGVDVSSGVEVNGRKDKGLIAEFIKEVKQWERL